MNAILSAGEWEALIVNTADQARHLVYRLAAHHGHVTPTPDNCPLCAAKQHSEEFKLTEGPR